MKDEAEFFNQEQLEFLRNHHESIIVGAIVAKFLHNYDIIERLEANEEFQRLFADLGWDTVLDYFEDSSIYDGTLRRKLHEQFISLGHWSQVKQA